MRATLLLLTTLSLMACNKSGSDSAPRGDSADIAYSWTWQSGSLKMLDLRSASVLDLSAVSYSSLTTNKFYDIFFADHDGNFHSNQKLSVKTDVTFHEASVKFLEYSDMTVMDCDQDLLVDCNTAPNGVMLGQSTPWDGTMTYYSDGTTLEICIDEDCGYYAR